MDYYSTTLKIRSTLKTLLSKVTLLAILMYLLGGSQKIFSESEKEGKGEATGRSETQNAKGKPSLREKNQPFLFIRFSSATDPNQRYPLTYEEVTKITNHLNTTRAYQSVHVHGIVRGVINYYSPRIPNDFYTGFEDWIGLVVHAFLGNLIDKTNSQLTQKDWFIIFPSLITILNRSIKIEFRDNPDTNDHIPGWAPCMGCSLNSVVILDRMRRQKSPFPPPYMLIPHVVAHEIGHLGGLGHIGSDSYVLSLETQKLREKPFDKLMADFNACCNQGELFLKFSSSCKKSRPKSIEEYISMFEQIWQSNEYGALDVCLNIGTQDNVMGNAGVSPNPWFHSSQYSSKHPSNYLGETVKWDNDDQAIQQAILSIRSVVVPYGVVTLPLLDEDLTVEEDFPNQGNSSETSVVSRGQVLFSLWVTPEMINDMNRVILKSNQFSNFPLLNIYRTFKGIVEGSRNRRQAGRRFEPVP